MTCQTIVTIQVREDRPDFHGVTAHVAVKGNGSPEQFRTALALAMKQAGVNLAAVQRADTTVPLEYSV
jgi:hypothetical protein